MSSPAVSQAQSYRYVAPFAVLVALLVTRNLIAIPTFAAEAAVAAGTLIALLAISRPVLDLRIRNWWGALAVGAAVFVVWIAPDLLWPGYRTHWLFSNALIGSARAGTLAPGGAAFLALRTVRSALIVPAAEELFWRAWLMRWIIHPKFETLPLGSWSARSFWIVAILFASEHGSFWAVGLLAGIAYNWWMLRTGSLGDLILAHGTTNLLLSGYVIATGKWEYWS